MLLKEISRLSILALAAALSVVSCSKQSSNLPAAAPSTSYLRVATPTIQFSQIYSEPVAKELSSVNVSFNNTKAYALTIDDLQVLDTEGLLSDDDRATLDPFVKRAKK